MIDGIGKSGAGRIEPQRAGAGQGAAPSAPVGAAATGARSAAPGGVVAELVASGPPIDGDKVSAIRQAIAQGRYAVDPDAIADRMIAADLGR
ncbi:MAG TPA: flagellar biosynthesis anti-sigma factor FlgM [Allosphingosinicella sp.]|jgi:negative regulator of flagellin synthesis FlgM